MSRKSSDSSRSSQGPQLRSHNKSASRSYPSVASIPQRRQTIQAKSTRQQFSACGACRMRRVRCDLKDLQASNPEACHTSCSNCKERGLKCVDEFADVKAVKLLRRGRRLQQVEAVYGKASPEDDMPSLPTTPAMRSIIPQIKAEFFSSPFFRRLLIQRPVLEATEFTCRYFASMKGNTNALGVAGELICMVLTTWAVSFGVNEYGEEEPHGGVAAIRNCKDHTNEMVRELLYLVDTHALLRKPSWDSVRFLLLLLPLTELVQTPMERLTMYEATINQTYTLCSLASSTSVNSGQGELTDALIRMNIFNYAYVHEGLTTGLRGGRLLLSDDDLTAFQHTLPAFNPNAVSPSAMPFTLAHRYAKAPLRLSYVCRQVHRALTGPRVRQINEIDEERLRDAWESLDLLWEEFDSLRHMDVTTPYVQPDEIERFIHGWQIVIFECHNIIREALKQRLVSMTGRNISHLVDNAASRSPRFTQISQLHAIAVTKCNDGVRHVVAIIRRNLGHNNFTHNPSAGILFQFDASLVRDGIFFASFLLAGEPSLGGEGDLHYCIRALREMRWAFCKSEEREHTVNMVSETRMAQVQESQQVHGRTNIIKTYHDEDEISVDILPPTPYQHDMSPTSGRRLLRQQQPPPISILAANGVIIDSGPNTSNSISEDGGMWSTLQASSSTSFPNQLPTLSHYSGSHSTCSSTASTPPRYSPPDHQRNPVHPHLDLLNNKADVLHPTLMLSVNGPPNLLNSTSDTLHSPRSSVSGYGIHDLHAAFNFSGDANNSIIQNSDHAMSSNSVSSAGGNIAHPPSPITYNNQTYYDSSGATAFPSPSPTSDGSASGAMPSPSSFTHFGGSSFYIS